MHIIYYIHIKWLNNDNNDSSNCNTAKVLPPFKHRPFTPFKHRPFTPFKHRPFTKCKPHPFSPFKPGPINLITLIVCSLWPCWSIITSASSSTQTLTPANWMHWRWWWCRGVWGFLGWELRDYDGVWGLGWSLGLALEVKEGSMCYNGKDHRLPHSLTTHNPLPLPTSLPTTPSLPQRPWPTNLEAVLQEFTRSGNHNLTQHGLIGIWCHWGRGQIKVNYRLHIWESVWESSGESVWESSGERVWECSGECVRE